MLNIHKRFMWTCTLELGATKVCEANAPQVLERIQAEFAKHGFGTEITRHPVKNPILTFDSGSHTEGLVSCSMLTGSVAPDIDQMHVIQTFHHIHVGKLLFPVPDLPGYYRIPNCETSIGLGLIGSRPQLEMSQSTHWCTNIYHDEWTCINPDNGHG